MSLCGSLGAERCERERAQEQCFNLPTAFKCKKLNEFDCSVPTTY